MTRAQAIKKLQSIFGKRACWRVDSGITSPERRAQAAEATQALRTKFDAVKARSEARAKELLSDPIYQELIAEQRGLRKALDQARADMGSYKFAIGTSDGMFFHVTAQGDTWEECFQKLEAEKKKAS